MTESKMDKLIHECLKHIQRLRSASEKMSPFMPLDTRRYENLTDDEVEHIDQFLFRFAKLQDTIGDKLFVALLTYFQEDNIKNKPFLDILNRLEQLQILSNKDDWIALRKIRNDISHHYEDDSHEMAPAINAIHSKLNILIEIFHNVKNEFDQAKRDRVIH